MGSQRTIPAMPAQNVEIISPFSAVPSFYTTCLRMAARVCCLLSNMLVAPCVLHLLVRVPGTDSLIAFTPPPTPHPPDSLPYRNHTPYVRRSAPKLQFCQRHLSSSARVPRASWCPTRGHPHRPPPAVRPPAGPDSPAPSRPQLQPHPPQPQP